MKLSRINVESFGRLSGKDFAPSDRINIIVGENESGKSTVASFLKFMLYGFAKKGASAIYENDKKKYPSWYGAGCVGSVGLECADGKKYLVEREYISKDAKNRISDAVTGSTLYTDSNAGEVFLGVDEATYLKTAFVSQNDMTASRMDKMAQAVQNIVLSASETVSVKKAAEKLKDAKNELLNSRGKGKIADIEAELASLDIKLQDCFSLHEKLVAAEAALEREKENISNNKERLSKLYDEKKARDALDAKALLETINEAKTAYEKAAERYGFSQKELLRGEKTLNEDDLAELRTNRREYAASLSELSKKTADAQKNSDDAKNFEVGKEKESSLYEKESRDQNVFSTLREKYGDIRERIKKYGRLSVLFFCLVVTFPLGIVFALKKNGAKGELEKLIFENGCENEAEFSALIEGYAEFREKKNEFSLLLRLDSDAMKDLTDRAENKKEELCRRVEIITERNVSDVESDAEEAENLLSRLLFDAKKNEAEKDKREAIYETYISQNDIGKLSELSKSTDMQTVRSAEQIDHDIAYYERALELLFEREKERIRELGELSGAEGESPEKIDAERIGKKETLEKYKLKNAALETALCAIESAGEDIRNSVSPRLTERASELFCAITGGKYEKLTVDPTLGLAFTEKGSSQSRDIGFLSAGATDAAYLCLRIALVEFLYAEPPVLVFDDAFVSTDNKRLANILDVICELSKKYQIFILSCHDREARMLEGKASVFMM